ncbi:hypothetical protein LMG29542_04894 [Paraburkholderia humisilvae]|uniref:HotDog ACOT-type domain-containing protein n=1 Tax=Paraburkholderia humisilvae TaxID=627669 RepID=A0A6J5EFG7_9BURK|nr:hypothetical protein LMG29542_04894 [Paraburkholderia humisilvae]
MDLKERGIPTLCLVPQPNDANVYGDVSGSWVMTHVDTAASIPAIRRANGRAVTIAMNSCVFREPVYIGDLVSFYATIVATGRTSVTVKVEVYAQRMGLEADVAKVTEATLTFVATDDDRRPRALPAITEGSPKEPPVWGGTKHPVLSATAGMPNHALAGMPHFAQDTVSLSKAD